MAEAHQAVGFSFSIHEEGLDVNVDLKVLREVWYSGLRTYYRRIIRLINDVKCGLYPGSVVSWFLFLISLSITTYFNFDITFGFMGYIEKKMIGPKKPVSAVLVVSAILWIAFIYSTRILLRALLHYRKWMFHPPGVMTPFTKCWLYSLKILKGHKPLLMSYQGALPSLPVPSVEETVKKYLESARPLMSDEEYEKIVEKSEEFKRGISRRLQRWLWLKYMWASNYVSDWWEEFVYLRGRSPLMVNSNFYCLDLALFRPKDSVLMKTTDIQVARAANLIHAFCLFRRSLDRQQTEPLMVNKVIPLCSAQYERVFNTTRIPGVETDILKHWGDSRHIVVYHEGRFYKLNLYKDGKLLLPRELENALQKIIDDPALSEGEELLPALTSAPRSTWAHIRSDYFSTGVNRISLDTIERAAFFVCLDSAEHEYDFNDPRGLDDFAKCMLCGNGTNRWFDKSFTFVVLRNARIGLNVEHSWGDAPITGQMWESVLAEEIVNLKYESDGHTRGVARFEVSPTRLTWKITPHIISIAEECKIDAKQLVAEVDLKLLMFDLYGKGFMKRSRLSPDGFLQMALQLAYFRDVGHFSLTYESSMTRLFREGRTETVRPVTAQSCAFVRAVEDSGTTVQERFHLLQEACNKHVRISKETMAGRGIDRHLFCLYVISKYLGIDSPFLNQVLSEPWRLSTSQTPHDQTHRIDFVTNPEYMCFGGGFGPVAHDGYGVSYIIAGEDVVFFHISSNCSSKIADSARFRKQIEKALRDMKAICDEMMAAKKKEQLAASTPEAAKAVA